MMRAVWMFIIVLLAFAAGCGPSQPGGELPSDPSTPPVQETPSTPLPELPNPEDTKMPPVTPASPSLENLIEKAKADLAQRLNLVLTQISLIEAKVVTWSDSSLGCPQPGMRYKQVPEDGVLIVLQANGMTYEYHGGGNRGLFLCQKASKEPTPPQIDLLDLLTSSPGASDPDVPTPDNSIPPGEDN